MNTLVQHILQPAVSRIGTIVATWLVATGFNAEHAVAVETAFTALVLFGVELGLRAVIKGRAR